MINIFYELFHFKIHILSEGGSLQKTQRHLLLSKTFPRILALKADTRFAKKLNSMNKIECLQKRREKEAQVLR